MESDDAPTTATDDRNDEQTAIKTMKLYSNVERIDNELQALGIHKTDPILDPTVLSKFDSMHYEGDDSVLASIDALKMNESSVILDVGSGFGGPARLLARETKCCMIVALELQVDVHEKATELTKRCGLDDRVKHVRGNFLEWEPTKNELSVGGDGEGDADGGSMLTFDGIVSWLVFLHIPDKKSLLTKCFAVLKAEGSIFVDDFYMRKSFTDTERLSLANDVYCSDLLTKDEYITALEGSGFKNITFIDKTTDWTVFCNERLETFESDKDRFERIHGTATFEKLLHFYKAMVKLFNGGNLGGVRLCATKKC